MNFMRIILLVVFCGAITSMAFAEEQKEKKDKVESKPEVRKLVYKPADRLFGLRFGGKSRVTVLKDAAAVEKLLGKENAKPLLKLVDFAKEQAVLVSWSTSGPPEGKLKYEIKKDEGGRKLVFYVQEPAGGGIRGMRARLGADFFAVSKDFTISFKAKERPKRIDRRKIVR